LYYIQWAKSCVRFLNKYDRQGTSPAYYLRRHAARSGHDRPFYKLRLQKFPILLQTNTETYRHQHLLAELIKKSDLSILCSGWIKLPGLKDLLPAIDSALENGAKIIVYSNLKQTLDGVAGELASRSALTHHMVDDTKRALHTKIYYFETGEQYTAVIGSANITKGGLSGNEELSVRLAGTKGDQLYHELQQYLQSLASMKFAKR
jgi:HKD family nuclease